MGQADRQGHQLGGLVAGITEHDALIACSHQIEWVPLVVVGFVHPLSDVRRLLVEGHQHRAAVGIKAPGSGAAVADLLDHAAHEGVEVDPCRGGYLTCDQAQPGVHYRFASHA